MTTEQIDTKLHDISNEIRRCNWQLDSAVIAIDTAENSSEFYHAMQRHTRIVELLGAHQLAFLQWSLERAKEQMAKALWSELSQSFGE